MSKSIKPTPKPTEGMSLFCEEYGREPTIRDQLVGISLGFILLIYLPSILFIGIFQMSIGLTGVNCNNPTKRIEVLWPGHIVGCALSPAALKAIELGDDFQNWLTGPIGGSK